jgi:hypothetical protein
MDDLETHRRFDLLKPPRQAYESACRHGFWIGLLAYLVILVVLPHGQENVWGSLVTSLVIGGLAALSKIHEAHTVISPPQRKRLGQQLVLVQRQEALRAAGAAAAEEIESSQAAMAKLAELSLRMQRLDDGTYGDRIAELARARAHWARRLKVNERLIAGYEHECQMLAIEIDALDSPEIFPAQIASDLDAKAAELVALEETAGERRRRRAAEAEVINMLV